MEDQQHATILEKLAQQDKKLDAIFRSAEKTRKYFLATLIVTLVVTILPLIGLLFAIPAYLSQVSESLNMLK